MKKILAALILVPSLAFAWQPTKPVTVVFPNGPGAGNEISFRIVAKIVEEKNPSFKWNPEYRPGADGNIAINHFVTVPRDGHTIAVPACQSNWVTPEILFKDMIRYNPMDLEPIANIARSPLAFWAHPSSKINTPEEFVAAIRNKQNMMVAIGGGGHKLAVEYLVDRVSVPGTDNLQTVMYKGPAQALLDVMGGHVEFGVTPVAVGYPQVQAGKLKFIGIADTRTLPGLEHIPLMSKAAPGLSIHGCWNMVLPPGTPQEIQAWYRDQFVPAIQSAEAAARFRDNMMYTTPAEHSAAGVRAAMARLQQTWQPIARRIDPNK